MNLKNLSMNSFLHYLEKLFLMLGIPGGLEPQNEYIASIHFRYFSRVSSDSRGSGLKFHFPIVFGCFWGCKQPINKPPTAKPGSSQLPRAIPFSSLANHGIK
jgi:hypothetical protein